MRLAASRPTPPVATLLGRCRTPRCLAQLHARIVRLGLHNYHALLARFVAACDALACPSAADSLLSDLPPHAVPLTLRNTLLASLSRHSPLHAALAQFNLIRRNACPDAFSFPSLLRACARVPCIHTGSALHAAAIRLGVDTDLFVRTALIQFYGRCCAAGAARALFDSMTITSEVSWTSIIMVYVDCGDVLSARECFDRMSHRNVVHWNAMVHGYVKCGDLEGARKLFEEMPQRTAAAHTSLIDGYAKAGDMQGAKLLFDKLQDNRDVFAWSAMISGYAQNGYPREALRLFNEFRVKGICPDELVIVALMTACSQLGNIMLARWIEGYITSYPIDMNNAHVLAGLVNMNAKCGDMERATVLFESMPVRDVFSYCSMMQGHCLHGSANEAVELFSRMLLEGLSPDNAVFTVVLTACNHAGLVEEGKKYFGMMKDEYLIEPCGNHYACLVSLLGRFGMLRDAYELIKSMPGQPHPGSWGALLGGCILHGDVELGKIAAQKLFEIEPDNAGNYVSLSNIYANIDRWVDVSQVRAEMSGKGITKIAGRTHVLQ